MPDSNRAQSWLRCYPALLFNTSLLFTLRRVMRGRSASR
ncbi:hypothetical protein K788_0002827 [Paraburkholderia caribensis MBA4]|uniref:Uncharacterized protein n=1 Tax=Paraburkholderia caribensis MBA4 TaxID=1323664 RepID=A0A0P0RDC7_9BURK|nr:hypothetical protein K788_0002827 [Paraburkholderia caribensis MBA4]